jgi:uncharacterized protein (TIGR02996 family)
MQKAFEEDIAKDPYDWDLRKIYADWCDENGLDDMAAFQRNWTPTKHREAEDWLREYAEALSTDIWDEDTRPKIITYEMLIAKGHAVLEGDDTDIRLGFDTPDMVYSGRKTFWRYFKIVTGRLDVDDDMDTTFVRCAC